MPRPGSSELDKRVGMGIPYPQPVEFTLDHRLCDRHWYLDAVLGRDLHDPAHVWLVLKAG
jgi:hypothetical protein